MSRVLSKRVKSCTFAKCNRLLLHPEITRLLPLPPSAFTLPRMHFRHVHYQDTTNRTSLSPLISPYSGRGGGAGVRPDRNVAPAREGISYTRDSPGCS